MYLNTKNTKNTKISHEGHKGNGLKFFEHADFMDYAGLRRY